MGKLKAIQIKENVVISEILLNSDIIISSSIIGDNVLISIPYNVSQNVFDGRTRRIKFEISYVKSTGNTSTNFKVNIGGNNITFNTNSMGSAAVVDNFYVFELFINFRNNNKCNIFVQYIRYNSNSIVNSESKKLKNVNWNKSISNNIDLIFGIVTGNSTHILTLEQKISELI